MKSTALTLTTLVILALPAHAQSQRKGRAEAPSAAPTYDPSVPTPTHSEVRYGDHPRQVLDFWKAESNEPTPLVFIIHGGGWQSGEKERANRFAQIAKLLDSGISVVSINYRLIRHAEEDGIRPPVKAPLHDAARALQFVRSKSSEWNLDKPRIGAAGGSAGACSSLWLAFHDDLADPQSADPVARESSRSNFGVKLQEQCRVHGVTCELVYPGAPNVKHTTPTEYLIATLKSSR